MWRFFESFYLFTCRQSGELALEQHSVFRSIWSMQAKSVSSSLCLQNDFKSVVEAEIAQPVDWRNKSIEFKLIRSYDKTNLVGTLVIKLASSTTDRSSASRDQSTQSFGSCMPKSRPGCRGKTFGDFAVGSLWLTLTSLTVRVTTGMINIKGNLLEIVSWRM